MSQSVLQNRNRIQWITRQYHSLRGLIQIPFGIWWLILAAEEVGWLPWYEFWKPLSDMAVWILVGIAWWRINRYYTTTFGQVRRTPKDQMYEIVFAIIFLIAIYVVGIAEYVQSWPVSIACMVLSIVWFWPLGRIRPASPSSVRYLVSALLMAGIGLLPLTGVVAATDVYVFGKGIGVALFGGLFIINGLLDHRILVQSLPLVREEA